MSQKYGHNVVDPLVNTISVSEKTGLESLKNIPENKKYSLIIFALNHKNSIT